MLQKIGKDRRIDIARQTLTKLVTTTIPAGTPFAFRVFGRMEDSCQSDLDVPLGPLNVQAVSAKIAGLEPKNGAKTAIGASLEQVASDLRSGAGRAARDPADRRRGNLRRRSGGSDREAEEVAARPCA